MLGKLIDLGGANNHDTVHRTKKVTSNIIKDGGRW